MNRDREPRGGPAPVRLAWLAALCAIALAPPARAGTPAPVLPGPPVLIRLEGTRGAPTAGAPYAPEVRLFLRGKDLPFRLDRLRVLSGTMLASRILDAVRPYESQFVLRGPASLLARVEGLADGEWAAIEGSFRFASRDLLISRVELRSPEPAAPPPPGEAP